MSDTVFKDHTFKVESPDVVYTDGEIVSKYSYQVQTETVYFAHVVNRESRPYGASSPQNLKQGSLIECPRRCDAGSYMDARDCALCACDQQRFAMQLAVAFHDIPENLRCKFLTWS